MNNDIMTLQFKCECENVLDIINEPYYAGFDEEPVYIVKLKCDNCGTQSMWASNALDAYFSISRNRKSSDKLKTKWTQEE